MACSRRSGVVSTSTDAPPAISMKIDGRDRVSRGSVERQVAQSHPIIGTPCDVPEPSTSTLAAEAGVITSRRHDALLVTLRVDKTHAELIEDGLEQLLLVRGEIAASLFFEQRQNIDHLTGSHEIDRAGLLRAGLEAIAEMHGSRRRQRQDKR